ncbi:MAG: toll/interleukin-1 receptor domain-containing protein [Azospirillaceae bacterium]|nr:toll/interleukin-1 receptor domain-containing protein [Azospirillaceae bacterium]
MSKFYLPSKVHTYLKRLQIEYASDGKSLLLNILNSARILVVEEAGYDDWNGGMSGHDVKFFLPVDVLSKIKIREQKPVAEEIRSDLSTCAQTVENEYFRAVTFELENEMDPEFQLASPLSRQPQVDPDNLSIWSPGQIRLFISHRDIHKAAAKALGTALEDYGISAFVAHDTIQPLSTWQHEIVKGLQTMEIMLAFITDDFHESTWTNQEIGFALGRCIPVISLKLGSADPEGFIGNLQALRGHLTDEKESAPAIYKLISERFGNKHRLQGALVNAFVASTNFDETRHRFDRLFKVVEKLTDDEVLQIIDGFSENDQLHKAIYLTNQYERLKKFLERCTDAKFAINGRTISRVDEETTDAIPF